MTLEADEIITTALRKEIAMSRQGAEALARAILAALAAKGFKLWEREPTEAITTALYDAFWGDESATDMLRAAWDAAE